VTTATSTLREWAHLNTAKATLRLDVPSAPVTVIADPDYDVFRRLHPEETPPILRDVTLNPSTVLLVVTASPEAERVAHALARRLLGTEPRRLTIETASAARLPLLLIGTGTEVRAAIDALALGSVPAAIADRGNVSVWTGEHARGAPYAVIAAAGVDALAAVQRPLPHHGRASYLAFQDSRTIVIGTWPRHHGPLRIDIGQ
jgi:hypothetical protein